jgi:predicted CxxxxCH...CXXCH cytochrome family protein
MNRFSETLSERLYLWLLIFCIVIGVTGCSDLRERPVAPLTKKLVYEDDIRPLLLRDCVPCHGSTNPAGGYDLSSYIGLLGGGSDALPNALPGDPKSLLVTVIQPGGREYARVGSEENAEKLRKWVVEDSLALAQPTVHPSGWLDPTSPNFHGQQLRKVGWSFGECTPCHGADYTGGISKRACTVCHTGSPEACGTCHGGSDNAAPPKDLTGGRVTSARGVGAHQTHVREGVFVRALDCVECHVKPQTLNDAGHLNGTPEAEVTFGVLARTGGANPVWNGTTCQSVYCHGTFTGGNRKEITWTSVGTGQAVCGTCHNLPPNDPIHPKIGRCQLCHFEVVDAHLNVDKIRHINGTVDVMIPEACNACHGDEESPAPPRDTAGNTDAIDRGVGAHRNHVMEGKIARALDCTVCHVTPQRVTDPGHIDTDLPAEVLFGAFAKGEGTEKGTKVLPTWDGATLTCRNTYCHGAFTNGNADYAPVWTQPKLEGEVCGTCHGLPPPLPHPQLVPGVLECVTCHPKVVDKDLTIIDRGLHLNGKVELF